MRWTFAIPLIVCLGAPVNAEITVIERLEDCLGPRSELLAHREWYNSGCPGANHCDPLDLQYHRSTSSFQCSVEALGHCVIRPEKDCLGRLETYLRAEVTRVQEAVTIERRRAVLATKEGVERMFLETKLEQLEDPYDAPGLTEWVCGATGSERQWPLSALEDAAACDYFFLLSVYSSVINTEVLVQKIEARQ